MSNQTIKYSNDIRGKDTRRSYIMCKAAEVGKIVVNKCLDKDIFINTKKLQKLLVLMQLECIKRSKKALFKEDIVIWSCGVAIKEVNSEFSSEIVRFTQPQVQYIPLLRKEEESVDFIIEKYGKMSASDINQLSMIKELSSLSEKSCSGVPHITATAILEKYSKNEH